MMMPSHARAVTALAALAYAAACGSHESARAPDSAKAEVQAPATSASASAGGDPLARDAGIVESSGGAGVEVLPAERLAGIAASLSQESTTARSIFNHGSYWAVQARRVADGVPEVHDHWEDVAIVQAGRATLLVGGRVEGSRLESPGEHRGGRIVGGTRYPVATGDVIVVPVGLPHQYEVARGDSIRYLTIKAPPRAKAAAP